MNLSPKYLLDKIDLTFPLIGVYDAPEKTEFMDMETPPRSMPSCFFAFYKKWEKGRTMKLSPTNFGCGGCGTWMLGETTRSRQEYIEFLADDEGLKADHELMDQWLEFMKPHKPEHGLLFIGPLVEEHYKFLKTITFFVNPDQLSVLMIGAQYFHNVDDPEPVKAAFGSGCMQMLTHFEDLSKPQAMIGATDMAMRKYLPKDILAFTVTVPMFEQLCSIDNNSFLEKPFLAGLKKARNGRL